LSFQKRENSAGNEPVFFFISSFLIIGTGIT